MQSVHPYLSDHDVQEIKYETLMNCPFPTLTLMFNHSLLCLVSQRRMDPLLDFLRVAALHSFC